MFGLVYHHICTPTKEMSRPARKLACDLDTFKRHLDYLMKHGYRTLTFENVRDGLIPDKPIILTFDDGYDDQWFAFEELRHRDMIGVFFIVSSLVGADGYLSAEQVRKIACTMEVGSHGVTHRALDKLIDFEIEGEINKSKERLERILPTEVISFAYPYGKYDIRVLGVMAVSKYHYGRAAGGGPGEIGLERNFEVPAVSVMGEECISQLIAR